MAVLGDKAIQMRAAAAAATPTSPDSLPAKQEGVRTPNTEDEAEAASTAPVQGKDNSPVPITPGVQVKAAKVAGAPLKFPRPPLWWTRPFQVAHRAPPPPSLEDAQMRDN